MVLGVDIWDLVRNVDFDFAAPTAKNIAPRGGLLVFEVYRIYFASILFLDRLQAEFICNDIFFKGFFL